MKDLDLIAQLESGVKTLPKRALVALFATCSLSLLPEFQKWALLRGVSEELLTTALHIADDYAVSGNVPPLNQLTRLLTDLEEETPPGEAPDAISSTFAQDCWICADVCIRVLVDETYDPAGAIFFALEPVIQRATMQLFGVTDVGSSDHEERQVREMLAHPAVSAAVEFVRWAITFLQRRPEPSKDDIAVLRSRSGVLIPQV